MAATMSDSNYDWCKMTGYAMSTAIEKFEKLEISLQCHKKIKRDLKQHVDIENNAKKLRIIFQCFIELENSLLKNFMPQKIEKQDLAILSDYKKLI